MNKSPRPRFSPTPSSVITPSSVNGTFTGVPVTVLCFRLPAQGESRETR